MEIALAYLVRSCKMRATSDPCSPAGSCLYASVESARTTNKLLPMLWKSLRVASPNTPSGMNITFQGQSGPRKQAVKR